MIYKIELSSIAVSEILKGLEEISCREKKFVNEKSFIPFAEIVIKQIEKQTTIQDKL